MTVERGVVAEARLSAPVTASRTRSASFHVPSSMPSSELSNALNPNVVRPRNYDDVLLYQDQQTYSSLHHLGFHCDQLPQQPQHEHVPWHRSELELAVVEPTPDQRYPQHC